MDRRFVTPVASAGLWITPSSSVGRASSSSSSSLGGHDSYLGVNGMDSLVSLADKRNRNPNWTDGEIIRFLEILQETDVMRDLLAQRNKQVFCAVARRLCAEGAEKTWDQCRIKLKNLKSQYRYVKERIPGVATLDLEDEAVMKSLIAECQTRGISPSSLKHLRYLRQFLARMSQAHKDATTSSSSWTLEPIQDRQAEKRGREASVSPPPTNPAEARSWTIINEEESAEASKSTVPRGEPSSKRAREDSGELPSPVEDPERFIERFNHEMMERFLSHQRRVQASFLQWELEKQRQHEVSMERWRDASREHEKQMFGILTQVLSQCNSALTEILKNKDKKKEEEKKKRKKKAKEEETETHSSDHA